LIITIFILFSGCVQEKTKEITFENITLESEVVELLNASLDFKYDKSKIITRAEVSYLFHNIAGHIIETLNVTVNFYDMDNNLVAKGGPKYLRNLPIDYEEKYYFEPNRILYDGPEAYAIDHCRIIAVEE
jgi:hypothetical protein